MSKLRVKLPYTGLKSDLSVNINISVDINPHEEIKEKSFYIGLKV